MTRVFLALAEVLERVPYSKSEWYRGIKEGAFPKPYRLRPDKPQSRGACWSKAEAEEVLCWIKSHGMLSPEFAILAEAANNSPDKI